MRSSVMVLLLVLLASCSEFRIGSVRVDVPRALQVDRECGTCDSSGKYGP